MLVLTIFAGCSSGDDDIGNNLAKAELNKGANTANGNSQADGKTDVSQGEAGDTQADAENADHGDNTSTGGHAEGNGGAQGMGGTGQNAGQNGGSSIENVDDADGDKATDDDGEKNSGVNVNENGETVPILNDEGEIVVSPEMTPFDEYLPHVDGDLRDYRISDKGAEFVYDAVDKSGFDGIVAQMKSNGFKKSARTKGGDGEKHYYYAKNDDGIMCMIYVTDAKTVVAVYKDASFMK